MAKLTDRRLKLFTESDGGDRDDVSSVKVATVAQINFDPIAELERTQRALRRAEAEVAVGVPLIAQPHPQRHLSERLEAVLQSAAEALGCRAAGMYLLDDATTELKLRAAWNMPPERFTEQARPLATAMADLEALAGHAVALEDTALYGRWNLPEACGAAVCVPISSPTTPLGTLWVFATEARPFSDHEVNLVEISAGRIASDLERELLLTETFDTVSLRRSQEEADERRQARRPHVAPLCDRWEIAARSDDDAQALHDFYDWLTTSDGSLCAAIGLVEATDFAAALEIESLRSCWRAHTRHAVDCGHLLEWVNDDLYRGSTASVESHLLALRAAPNGTLALAAAGRATALVLGLSGARPLFESLRPSLGQDVDFRAHAIEVPLAVGELLLVADDARRIERIAADWNLADRRPAPRTSAVRVLDLLLRQGDSRTEGPRGTFLLLRRTS